MDVNDPPPQELPADPDAANVFLDTVNAAILRRWCKALGFRLKRNVKRAGLLKVLLAHYEKARNGAATVMSESADEVGGGKGDDSLDSNAADVEVEDAAELIIPPEFWIGFVPIVEKLNV